MVRTHVVIPQELLDEVDRRVGPRRRSDFVARAVEEKLARLHRAEVARKVAGSLSEVSTPGWETSDEAAEWVRRLRSADAERLADLQRQR